MVIMLVPGMLRLKKKEPLKLTDNSLVMVSVIWENTPSQTTNTSVSHQAKPIVNSHPMMVCLSNL
jgi:hypothetical protein